MKKWPLDFSIAHLARRAGISRQAMNRRLREIPAMNELLDNAKGRPRLSLADLKAMAPKVFESLALREMMGDVNSDEESDEEDAA